MLSDISNLQLDIINWGLIDYQSAWDKQNIIHQNLVSKNGKSNNSLIFCEHYPVFTIGKSGNEANFLYQQNQYKSIPFDIIKTSRGGDITFHGPNQMVVYPIFNILEFNLGIKSYVDILEKTVIELLQIYQINSSTLEHATGIWIKNKQNNWNKICAIGIRASQGVVMHGIALNISTDLDWFSLINPCGFTDKGVTSMAQELKKDIDKNDVLKHFITIFKAKIGL